MNTAENIAGLYPMFKPLLTFDGRKVGPHRVMDMPVVSFSFEYVCLDCGRSWSFSWNRNFAGQGYRDVIKAHLDEIAQITENEECNAAPPVQST